MPVARFDPLDFHERAVRTASHETVEEMRDLLVGTLADAGVEPRVDSAGNTLATREGDADGPHLVLNTHIDTVPPHVPFAEAEDGAVVRGRGSCDAKGPLAALLAGFLGAPVDRGRLTLAVTPDEETTSAGAATLAFGDDPLRADGYIVGEPTDLDVCAAGKGRFEGTLTVTGEAAHAAEPESGTNALRALAPLLAAIDTFDDDRGPGTGPRLGAPTLTATTVQGGEAINQVPATVRVGIDRRSVPPETADGFERALNEHLRTAAPADAGVEFALTERETPFLEAFATDADEPLVEALAGASGGDVRAFGAATEASYFAADAPTVVFGPGVLADDEGAVAHAEREYVRREDVTVAGEAVRDAVASLLG
ncbi:succinyl-diaminopimelate desuccinylase [Haloglomus irregulare]|uniref:Succinyl-diaminopimelate desuccinylase n=1 Tax=Haloglomus irregulare TaxID=2234134 RepID=A0A554NFD5_9EURY|nr:M20 family metallopeptidase [Haloglomus irregulare]TSD16091.1 succinyl-diaminopimelate desuccinylase [Haloglomus irregulare]